jgi:hypothetical protein
VVALSAQQSSKVVIAEGMRAIFMRHQVSEEIFRGK